MGINVARYFNDVRYLKNINCILKESDNSSIDDEMFYYKEIENKSFLNMLYPKILSYNFSSNVYKKSSIQMEYIDYPLLSDSFVEKKISLGKWQSIIFDLYYIIRTRFNRYKFKSNINELYRRNFYLKKNYDRIKKFIDINKNNNSNLAILWNKDLTINNKKTVYIEDAFELSYPHLLKLINNEPFKVIHGDLCFSNILCSEQNQVFKFIDPRGDFGGLKGIYGDRKYDVAKLYHSIDGLYDFVLSKKVSLDYDNNNIKINFIGYDEEYHKKIKTIFEEFFFTYNKRRNETKLLEAWLFLSMLPIHKDDSNRQLILALIGLEKLTEYLDENEG